MKKMLPLLFLLSATLAWAHDDKPHGMNATGVVEGEVRKVDREAKKITLRHDAIPKLDMPPMTMVYQVRDPAMLDRVKAGDRVRFEADKIRGAYTVIRLEPAGKPQ